MKQINITEEQRNLVISYYNAMNGCRIQYKNSWNIKLAERAIIAADGDTRNVRNFIKATAGQYNSFEEVVEALEDNAKKQLDFEIGTPAPEAPVEQPKVTAQQGLDIIGQVVVELLAKTKAEEIKGAVVDNALEEVKKFIAKEYGPIQRKVDLILDDKKVQIEGVVHNKFDLILKFVKADEPVFLTGPAGSGKNVLCQQVAKALGLDFYFSNAVTQEYKITGFTDAMGTYHESQFYKAFKNGGLFMLDEMDASIPEVLIILNSALANRYFDFPAPIGYVSAHPDFRVVAAGNTFGSGADYDYVGRNQLDAASIDRFAMVRIDYDPNIEAGCARGNDELLTFCRSFRKAVNESGIRAIVSYRAIGRMAKLDASMDAVELLETCLLKSLEKDDLKVVADKMGLEGNKYFTALKKAIARR